MSPNEARDVLLEAQNSTDNEVVAFELGQIAASLPLIARNKESGEYTTAKYLAGFMIKRAQDLMRRPVINEKVQVALGSVAAYGVEVLTLPDAGSSSAGPYSAQYRVGSRVQIAPLADLEAFMSSYKLHHAIVPEQLRYAGEVTSVRDVGYYHGGGPVYILEEAGDFGWLEPCLRNPIDS